MRSAWDDDRCPSRWGSRFPLRAAWHWHRRQQRRDADPEELLTAAELQTLVAPVALYPDTLLIQILVGATAPLDVVKADRLLARSEGADPAVLETQVKAEGFDASVEVLSLAFPEVLGQMAEHIEWTETVGTAMLAQSDDVLDAVQVMRNTAINTGALVDTEQQVVTRDAVTETVVIQPANPQVVYVPQYNPQVVYDNSLSNALITGAVTFGTVALIAEIFEDDDDWDGYWGCRNCGGWGGGPIIRDPDIDIDVDGNVNIGNRVSLEGGDSSTIDRNNLNVDRDNVNIDRDRTENNVGWRPDADKSGEARDKIAAKRGEGGATTLPITPPASTATPCGTACRRRPARATSPATGIVNPARSATRSRPTAPANRPAVNRPEADRTRENRACGEPSGRRPRTASTAPNGIARETPARARTSRSSCRRGAAPAPRSAALRKRNAPMPRVPPRPAATANPEIARNSSGSRAKAGSPRGGLALPRLTGDDRHARTPFALAAALWSAFAIPLAAQEQAPVYATPQAALEALFGAITAGNAAGAAAAIGPSATNSSMRTIPSPRLKPSLTSLPPTSKAIASYPQAQARSPSSSVPTAGRSLFLSFAKGTAGASTP